MILSENGPIEDVNVSLNLDSTMETSVLEQTVINNDKSDDKTDNVDNKQDTVDSANIPNNKLPNRTAESHPDWPSLPSLQSDTQIPGLGETQIPGLGDLDQLELKKSENEQSDQDTKIEDKASEKEVKTGEKESEKPVKTGETDSEKQDTEDEDNEVDMTNEELEIIKNFHGNSKTDSNVKVTSNDTDYNPFSSGNNSQEEEGNNSQEGDGDHSKGGNKSQEEDMDVDNEAGDDLSKSLQQAAQEVAKYEAQPEFVDDVEDNEDQVLLLVC